MTGRQNGDKRRPRGKEPDRARRTGRNLSSDSPRQPRQPERKTITAVPEGNLPRWVRDDLNRSTPRDRRPAALQHMEEGIARFADERFRAAVDHLTQVKALAPRAALARELLGLSYYYLENWSQALQELRAYRRFTGETLHMPVEMDCLRALKKHSDVDKTYELFRELGGDKDTEREAAVVYASHLLDLGRVAEAWRVIKPGRLISPAPASEVRRWYVAARVALAANDIGAARKFVEAIDRENPSLPGLDELKDRVGS
ncbi:MAG TPA: hypothetical protein VIB78_03540 [Acidimicrobiia bacterium]